MPWRRADPAVPPLPTAWVRDSRGWVDRLTESAIGRRVWLPRTERAKGLLRGGGTEVALAQEPPHGFEAVVLKATSVDRSGKQCMCRLLHVCTDSSCAEHVDLNVAVASLKPL